MQGVHHKHNDGLWCVNYIEGFNLHIHVLVLQISRLSEGSTGQIFATSSVNNQIKTWGL